MNRDLLARNIGQPLLVQPAPYRPDSTGGVLPDLRDPKRGDLLDATPESFDDLIRVNPSWAFFLAQKVAARFLERPAGGQYRSIINISSANAYAASPNRGEYCLSKSAVSMATKLFATRLGDAGIGVFEIRPGVIRTDMTSVAAADYDKKIAAGLTPMPRWGETQDVGRAAAALAGGAFAFSTGDAIHVDGRSSHSKALNAQAASITSALMSIALLHVVDGRFGR